MELTIVRDTFTPTATLGKMSVNGRFFCYTLEPRKSQEFGKPYAIAPGRYRVKLLWSPHFKETTPHLIDVPDFVAVEIHPGNYPCDTEACTLVGLNRNTEKTTEVDNSRVAFNRLMTVLGQRETGEPIYATYSEDVTNDVVVA